MDGTQHILKTPHRAECFGCKANLLAKDGDKVPLAQVLDLIGNRGNCCLMGSVPKALQRKNSRRGALADWRAACAISMVSPTWNMDSMLVAASRRSRNSGAPLRHRQSSGTAVLVVSLARNAKARKRTGRAKLDAEHGDPAVDYRWRLDRWRRRREAPAAIRPASIEVVASVQPKRIVTQVHNNARFSRRHQTFHHGCIWNAFPIPEAGHKF